MKWVGIASIVILLFSVFPLVAMLAWNGVMPAIFGLKQINYGQAMCLGILFHVIFPVRYGK